MVGLLSNFHFKIYSYYIHTDEYVSLSEFIWFQPNDSESLNSEFREWDTVTQIYLVLEFWIESCECLVSVSYQNYLHKFIQTYSL